VTLPDKLSDLIDVALRDLDAFIAEGNIVSMEDRWLTEVGGKCIGCLAGAVMCQSLGLREVYVVYRDLPEHLHAKMYALDNLRLGNVTRVFVALKRRPPSVDLDRRITPFVQSPTEFVKDMKQLADDLRSHGE
jgi:hypothetical protein